MERTYVPILDRPLWVLHGLDRIGLVFEME